MSDNNELRAIEDDLKRAERQFADVRDALADSQDAYERGNLLARLDTHRRTISRLRSDLRLCAERLKP